MADDVAPATGARGNRGLPFGLLAVALAKRFRDPSTHRRVVCGSGAVRPTAQRQGLSRGNAQHLRVCRRRGEPRTRYRIGAGADFTAPALRTQPDSIALAHAYVRHPNRCRAYVPVLARRSARRDPTTT